MMRDFKFLRRNSGKNIEFDEPENVPVNGKLDESSVSHMGTDSSSRPPLNTIQELGFKATKIDRTPSKVNGSKNLDSGILMKTPEKQRTLARNRYGWGSESRNEGKTGNMNMSTNTPRSCRTVGRAVSSGNTEGTSIHNTPTKSVNKPPNPGLSARPPVGGNMSNNGNLVSLSRGFQNSCSSTGTVNTVEVPHFDLKEDPSFWMDHNVQVLIRIRPLNNMELSTQGYNRCLKQESSQCLTFVGHPETRFTFDHVACESIDQETLFRMVGLPMVENCLSGYNSCIFAYGQTGSGKTHTMLGEINELQVKPSSYRGMTPRIFEFLFARIIAEEESRVDERLMYNCKCSFLEIYNEQITDLLEPSSTNLQLREDVKKGVYVENLSEFEVHTVGDILSLLSRGSANRRVAATNMNRESSRSHSVFTCVIESRWEKDSTSNLRFARLNLVDLAGSERQKTSGAEGERLKEAANINKSLSTLGHVIMVLVDGANSRTRHVPYRDSRLTFLLQDSLGGNSKTMIIANVTPSICSATETLNTLKFAQRAKLIQNNAVVNEDASGDVVALQYQLQLLKEELALLKRQQNVSRSLTFTPNVNEDVNQLHDNDYDYLLGHNNKNLTVSSKQLKSLETLMTGALRREQMVEISSKQHEAEIEQLNRLVRQREEENKCTKMMLKFREDKIRRMESLVAGSIPADSYLLQENTMLTEEIQMLREKVDRNPEVTRFALENIRLLEQLRRFQDFYEEGEREMLLSEVSELRNQFVLSLDENSKQGDHVQKEAAHDSIENSSLQLELERSQEELEKCRNNLTSCLERNEKLRREIVDLNALLENQKSAVHDHDSGIEVIKEPILEGSSGDKTVHTFHNTSEAHVTHSEEVTDMQLEEASIGDESSNAIKNETSAKYVKEVMDLQLKVDSLEITLMEESSARGEIEKKYLLTAKQYKDLKVEIEEAKSVIEALETQQLISINELEDLRNSNSRYAQELHEKELKLMSSNEEEKLNKMHDSLERARRTNKLYKNEREFNAINEEEMDQVRKQAEAETAEVIVCLQEEINSLQQQLHDNSMQERELKQDLTLLQEKYEEKERQLNASSEEWRFLTNEIEKVLMSGDEALENTINDLDDVTVCEKIEMITRNIFAKESRIKELNSCLEDAKNKGNEMEGMLRSLKGATLVMSEAHQQDCSEKDKIIHQLSSQLNEKSCMIAQLSNAIKEREEQIKKVSVCATSLFVIVNRFSELKDGFLAALTQKEAELDELKQCHKIGTEKSQGINNGTIILLKKELETALGSLNGVKTEMARLCSEKEVVQLSDKQNRKSIEIFVTQFLTLQSIVDNFEEKVGVAMISLNQKIQTVEERLQESCKYCFHKRKLYELELMDAKVDATQQAAESSCVRAKFAEAQYTIKDADVMINRLLIASETMKLDIEALKKNEVTLINERDTFKENFETLGQQFEADTFGMKKEIEELEGMILQIQSSVNDDLISTTSDFLGMKSQIHDSSKLIRSWIEDIWSEIIVKDCALAVLRVCYMGVLLQSIHGLNAENSLLYHGLGESNSLVSQLKEHNCKSREELEICRVVQWKLLADIKNSFDRVSKSTEETGVLSVKLATFEKKIISLQLQEEEMVERSNYMGTELSVLVRDMEAMNMDEKVRSLGETYMVDLLAKEIELMFVASELKQANSQKKEFEKENKNMSTVVEKLKEDMQLKDSILLDKELDVGQMVERSQMLEMSACKLQEELEMKSRELRNTRLNEEKVKSALKRHRALNEMYMVDLLAKETELVFVASELKQAKCQKKEFEKENKNMSTVVEKLKEDMQLKDSILLEKESEVGQMVERSQMLEMSACKLQEQMEIKSWELRNMMLNKEKVKSALKRHSALNDLNSKEGVNLMCTFDMKNNRVIGLLSERVVSLEKRFEEISGINEKMYMIIEEFEHLEKLAKEAISDNLRKDEVIEGLVFDLRLLQESASNNKDQKDEIEELTSSLESLEDELNENAIKCQDLESQLKEKGSMISMLEADVSREGDLVKSLFSEVEKLTESVKGALKAKETSEVELEEVKKANERLEMELVQLESAVFEMKTLAESRSTDLDSVSYERDDLHAELLEVRKELEMAQALAEENEAIAMEAKQMAETSRLYGEQKEEEVKLYEKSVEELEFIVNALESQVDMVKGEAERQRLQREELELEFQAFKQHINTVQNSDSDMKRLLNEKEKCLQEAHQRVQILEKEIASKDTEIVKHKAHITELNLHAEAQAREYKQTFRTLEVMADQVKSDCSAPHSSNSPVKKLENNASRSRGSGSPFKCIGIGLVQQMKSEKDEELTTAKKRIEELEVLAANRQKEIFTLNAKLAMSGSMTHDVLRDLLGIKMDMTTYSSLVDGHQKQEINEKILVHNTEGEFKEKEVIKLKQQLNELVIERKGWLEEIERKQVEMIAAQVALEQLRQRDHLLTTENEMFKTEISNHKKKVIDLEFEVKKLAGQQNLQQRIHHHTKIKEENNVLKTKNDEVSLKLRRCEATVCRFKEELANLRATNGKHSYDEESELQLDEKLKETENEKDRLAQKLAALCTTILKASGVTGPTSGVSVSMAEEALEQFQLRIATLERELQHLHYKNRMSNEGIRLSEIMPDEQRQPNTRSSTRTPFLSTLDR